MTDQAIYENEDGNYVTVTLDIIFNKREWVIVYSEHMALRLQKYAGLWVNLTKDESIQVWQVELPEMLTDGDF